MSGSDPILPQRDVQNEIHPHLARDQAECIDTHISFLRAGDTHHVCPADPSQGMPTGSCRKLVSTQLSCCSTCCIVNCKLWYREAGVGVGFYSAVANSTGALQIWPEHRYYANEVPYTPADNFSHFTIEQSLVDHVELVLYVQNMFNLSTNPVIAIGSSYSKGHAI